MHRRDEQTNTFDVTTVNISFRCSNGPVRQREVHLHDGTLEDTAIASRPNDMIFQVICGKWQYVMCGFETEKFRPIFLFG